MEELLEILEEINPDVDYETCTTLIDDHILDSFAILSLVSELEDAFDVQVSPGDMVAENFNSAEAIWNMVKRLEEEG
ncbi:MAG: acyl carrier protein [Roseburia sp.]|nr:acyl carrier protein [Roseburia sp.]